jgi:hypothetical protein
MALDDVMSHDDKKNREFARFYTQKQDGNKKHWIGNLKFYQDFFISILFLSVLS